MITMIFMVRARAFVHMSVSKKNRERKFHSQTYAEYGLNAISNFFTITFNPAVFLQQSHRNDDIKAHDIIPVIDFFWQFTKNTY